MFLDQKITERYLLYILLSSLGLLYLIHVFTFPGLFQGGDSTTHYLISKYSWRHPILLMDSWGKPVFTLVSSPFSQFGQIGMKIFNSLCALLSCLFVYRTSVALKIQNSLLAPLFLGFTVLYFYMTVSGYTEVFFGLILIYCIYNFIKEKYFYPSIFISFLPLVRSEGYFIVPLFFLVLLFRKKFRYVPLLLTGYAGYSILGYFVYDDINWLQNQNPYDGSAADIYGSGSLFHFIRLYPSIWGKPLASLAILGLIYMIYFLITKKGRSVKLNEELILVYGSFLIYLIAHSVFWWKGLFNSLGLERVMGAVMPVSALISLRGFNFLITFFSKWKLIKLFIALVLVIMVIKSPFQRYEYPLKIEGEEKLVSAVKNWYLNSDLKNINPKIYYMHPEIPAQLNLDPYNKDQCSTIWGFYHMIENYGYEVIPDSSLIFWDAHYGPNEGGIPLSKIKSDGNFRLIKSFYPEKPFMVLGNNYFEIHIFQKL